MRTQRACLRRWEKTFEEEASQRVHGGSMPVASGKSEEENEGACGMRVSQENPENSLGIAQATVKVAMDDAALARAAALEAFARALEPRRAQGGAGMRRERNGAERCLPQADVETFEPVQGRANADEVARLELALARCGLRLRRAAW